MYVYLERRRTRAKKKIAIKCKREKEIWMRNYSEFTDWIISLNRKLCSMSKFCITFLNGECHLVCSFFGCSCCCCCCWWVCCFQCMCSNSFVFLIFFFFDFSHFSQTKIIVFRWCEGISMLVASDFIAPFIVFIKTIENFQHSLIWMQNALYGLPFILNWKRVERQNRRIRRYCVCNSILFNAMWCYTVCFVQLFRLLASLYLTFYDAFPCALCVCCFPFGFFSFCPSFTRSNMYFVMIKIIFSDYRFFFGRMA